MRTRLALSLLALSTSLTTPALAGVDELLVRAEAGYGTLLRGDGGRSGASASATAWWGLTERVWLSGGAGAVLGPSRDTSPALQAFEGRLGLVAAFDVLRVVPYVEAGVSLVVIDRHLSPGFVFGIGADYWIDHDIGIGIGARVSPLEARAGDALLTAGLRAVLRFDL